MNFNIRFLFSIICTLHAPGILYAQDVFEVYGDSVNYSYGKGDYEKAIYYLDKMLELHPEDIYLKLHKGTYLTDQGKFEEAINQFSNVIDLSPNNVDAYVRRGIAYLKSSQYDSAIKDFSRKIGVWRHQDSIIYLHRAAAYFNNKDYEMAIIDYDSALKFTPNETSLLNNRAFSKVQTNNLVGALEDFDLALKIDSNYFFARLNRGQLYIKLQNYKRALIDLGRANKLEPNNVQVIFNLGCVNFILKDYQKAQFFFTKSKVQINTKEAYILSGASNYYLVKDELAVSDFKKALMLTPNEKQDMEIYFYMGLCQNNQKPRSGCVNILKAAEMGFVDAEKLYINECKKLHE